MRSQKDLEKTYPDYANMGADRFRERYPHYFAEGVPEGFEWKSLGYVNRKGVEQFGWQDKTGKVWSGQ